MICFMINDISNNRWLLEYVSSYACFDNYFIIGDTNGSQLEKFTLQSSVNAYTNYYLGKQLTRKVQRYFEVS